MKRKLQVFISSTFTDLIEERQAAVSAILKAGHIPAGMELFTAGDKSQMQTIETWIDESDVYMLILGGRYGSIEKLSGISYTELEYDYAVQQGKPVFSIVINEKALEYKVTNGGTQFMEKTNPKELALFREKVLTNISSFFDDQKDIKLCVYESLSNFSANRDLKGWISGDEVVDTKPLLEEIKKVTEENQLLKSKIDDLITASTNSSLIKSSVAKTDEDKFIEIKKLFESIDIKIPDDLSGEKNKISNLLRVFYLNKNRLINGVTNRASSSSMERFFYHNISPKLQVHGLTSNEKVGSTAFRRSSTTQFGNDFLAWMDKSTLLQNTIDEATAEEITTVQKSPEKDQMQ